MQITPVTPSDLAAIVAIERAGFSAAVAEDEAQYAARIHRLKDDFLVARAGDRVAGFIVGPATTDRRLDVRARHRIDCRGRRPPDGADPRR